PEGPWPQPPWCPGSPYIWPFNDPIPLETPTPETLAPSDPSAPDCHRADIFCVGMVTDAGGIDDRSFNQSAWEGLQQAHEEGLADQIDFLESGSQDDYEANIRRLATDGYDVVVTVGFGLVDATHSLASEYPDIFFIGVDQYQDWADTDSLDDDYPNLAGLVFAEDQAGFLAGALAAMMTEADHIGAVCATDAVPAVWRFGEGYRAGAGYIDPRVAVDVSYHNDVSYEVTFVDPEWGRATANAQIDNGADVIFGAGGQTGNGAITAAAQRGVYAIGVDTDQYYTLPEAAPRLLSSAIKVIPPGIVDLIRLAKEGAFPAGNAMGAVGVAPFHDLDSLVPQEVRERLAEIELLLASGELQTEVAPSAGEPGLMYVIQEGDTCASIAAAFNISVQALVEANNLDPICTITIGQVLVLP
ncbi:MAG: BMP family ABC transporter substrate-binding protein, partial [Anaerolineales bacterium]|nr:BMP family ABC transporter substrate-binding protein [Anaerolineales bacterium]